MNEYEGHWQTTFTGKKFHYLDPQPDEIDIEDIAHALSLTCRYGGHCKMFYSVGEHSIRVAEIVPEELKLQALLHDAAEAYLTDLPRPIKYDIPYFMALEDRIQSAIYIRFGVCRQPDFPVIKLADNILLATEARDLVNSMNDWAALPDPLTDMILPMSMFAVEMLFLARFEEYGGIDE